MGKENDILDRCLEFMDSMTDEEFRTYTESLNLEPINYKEYEEDYGLKIILP